MKKSWVRDVIDQVQSIVDLNDPEDMHVREDRIHRETLGKIATHSIDPVSRTLAAEALRTLDIEFPRWCA